MQKYYENVTKKSGIMKFCLCFKRNKFSTRIFKNRYFQEHRKWHAHELTRTETIEILTSKPLLNVTLKLQKISLSLLYK